MIADRPKRVIRKSPKRASERTDRKDALRFDSRGSQLAWSDDWNDGFPGTDPRCEPSTLGRAVSLVRGFESTTRPRRCVRNFEVVDAAMEGANAMTMTVESR